MLYSFFYGLTTGASLIIAIGAQNAFVLTQGIRKRYFILVPSVCALIDTVLISAGISGFGLFFSSNRIFQTAAALAGACFLFFYGIGAFRAVTSNSTLEKSAAMIDSRKKAVITTLSISLLNPHVYLDTVVLLGSIGNSFGGRKTGFLLGAVSASYIWFFLLSLGGKIISPLFLKPSAWKILNAAVGLSMWLISFSLIRFVSLNF